MSDSHVVSDRIGHFGRNIQIIFSVCHFLFVGTGIDLSVSVI